jgi:hypothetical protein
MSQQDVGLSGLGSGMEDTLLDWLSTEGRVGASSATGGASTAAHTDDDMMISGFDSSFGNDLGELEYQFQEEGYAVQGSERHPFGLGSSAPPPPLDAPSTSYSTHFADNLTMSPVISQVQSMIVSQRGVLERLRRAQRETVTAPSLFTSSSSDSPLTSLSQQHDLIAEEVQRIVLALQSLKSQQYLSPPEMSLCHTLMDSVAVHSAQLNLFRSELEYIRAMMQNGASASVPSLVALVITRAPFPSIWMKRSQVADQESIQIQLLTATGIQLLEVAAIKPHLLCMIPSPSSSKKPKTPFDIDSIPIDPSTLAATVRPTFLSGTRNDVAQLKFSIQLRLAALYGGSMSANSVTLEASSPESAPFIILTSESQLARAVDILFHRDAFHYYWGRPTTSIPWPLYVNFLQYYFAKATRQPLDIPVRPLSPADIRYFHSHFFNFDPNVDSASSQKFWEWFGVVLQKLRYQKHWLSLFFTGLLYGFATRDDVSHQLLLAPVGASLLRFSETSAGSVSMAFRVANDLQPVKNYLIKTEDIVGLNKSLPDFILQRPEVQGLLQLTAIAPNCDADFKIISKSVLQQYGGPKTPTQPTTSPYDDL